MKADDEETAKRTNNASNLNSMTFITDLDFFVGDSTAQESGDAKSAGATDKAFTDEPGKTTAEEPSDKPSNISFDSREIREKL